MDPSIDFVEGHVEPDLQQSGVKSKGRGLENRLYGLKKGHFLDPSIDSDADHVELIFNKVVSDQRVMEFLGIQSPCT